MRAGRSSGCPGAGGCRKKGDSRARLGGSRRLEPTVGHERRGHRPCVVVSDPEVVHDQRYRMIGVVPLTGTPGVGALYPELQQGASGLTKTSYALVDQIRSIDRRRVRRAFGRVRPEEVRTIEEGLRLFLGLDGETA